MIYYLADPLELLENYKPGQQNNYQLPSGGIVTAEMLPDSRVRVISIISTDPMDYMNASLSPGQVIEFKKIFN